MTYYLLALDQGTTSTRAILFTTTGRVVGIQQQPITQYFPAVGWVEHDPEEIWCKTLQVLQDLLRSTMVESQQIVGLGITNQRETTLIWDKLSGQPLHRAIVWQDRRTAEYCQQLTAKNYAAVIQQKTGLLVDPYFSATKLHWLLHNVPAAQQLIPQDRLAFGTVDSFLLWKLTHGQQHATDATNAARTMLFNIHTQQWDPQLLELFNIPATILPEVKDSAAEFGETDPEICGVRLPIRAVLGDQQAATVGQACFLPGMIKSTYGTGCFLMVNTGNEAVLSQHRLLTTIAYRLAGTVTYALEGSIFVAGAAVQWLRDTLKLIHSVQDTQMWAAQTPSTDGVYLVPAFTGLGAPYWDPQARGAILGLTRDSGVGHIVRAALESVCYQTKDLLDAIQEDIKSAFSALRVDGGMVANDWVMQFLADILNIKVERPPVTETTALGAAYLAGLQAGVYSSLTEISQLWQAQTTFSSRMPESQRETLYQGWLQAVQRIRG